MVLTMIDHVNHNLKSRAHKSLLMDLDHDELCKITSSSHGISNQLSREVKTVNASDLAESSSSGSVQASITKERYTNVQRTNTNEHLMSVPLLESSSASAPSERPQGSHHNLVVEQSPNIQDISSQSSNNIQPDSYHEFTKTRWHDLPFDGYQDSQFWRDEHLQMSPGTRHFIEQQYNQPFLQY